MNTKKILIYIFLAVLISSCRKYLDPLPNGDISGNDIWKYPNMIQGLIGQCYDNIPRNYNDNEGSYLDCATDNAVMTSTTNAIRLFATGTLTTNQDPFLTYWNRDYTSLNLLNTFLKDDRGYFTRYLVNPQLDSLLRRRLQGEAFALRAWFEWDLLKKFGGKGTNGQLLGFPIVLEPVDITKNVNFARNSYDECVKQIIADCDSAILYLPIAHRDFLVTNPTFRTYIGSRCWGRMDGITAKALKAQVYLTWASPLFNPANDVSRWDLAAKFAKQVIDFKLTVDNVTNGFVPVNRVNWFNPNFPGIILTSRYLNANDDMERMFYPAGFQGKGIMGPSQELINTFPMKTGYPINDPANRGSYDPLNPYLNRDPRFYSVVFYNSSTANRASNNAVMYTFENFEGGKDAAGANVANSRTNYHIKKFVYMGLNWSDGTISRQPHAKFIFEWANMCLTFAEAANKVVGPTDAATYGLSAKAAIAYLRSRKTYDDATGITADPYLNEVAAAGQAPFDKLVRDELRISTCFEGTWFYDLRRWSTSLADLNKTVHGAKIIKNTDGTFVYNLNNEVESRVFTSQYLPIPYSEIIRMGNLVQNEGWVSWQ